MAWGAVIAAGGAIVGSVISSKSAKKDRNKASSLEQQELDFNQQRYDDWTDVYGDLQANLSEYFQGLTPDYYEAIGLESIELEKERALTSLNERLAQRGISDSGLAAAAELQVETGAMEQRSEIRRNAPAMVAEDQLRFLQVGLGQNPADSVASTLANQASRASADARYSERVAGEATGAAVTAVGTALADYATSGEV